jgi:hypothetical protein
LLGYHLNFKSSDFVVLGGVSGTGKSSLPLIYATALAGEESADASIRFLRIPVNPTWVECHDLMGRVNALECAFRPAESGLYRHLVWANAEFEASGQASGFYTVVLDEMNLAHVENYLAPILNELGSSSDRRVRVFEPASVKPTDPFYRWAEVALPDTLRFVGTVNYDETTRRISRRVLDRAPEMRIESTAAILATGRISGRCTGPEVTLGQLHSWRKREHNPPEWLAFLGEMEPLLRKMGRPLMSRRRNAIERFLAFATPEVCNRSDLPIDLAIAQRIVPTLRGLFRPDHRKAQQDFGSLIEKASLDLQITRRLVEEIKNEEDDLGPNI